MQQSNRAYLFTLLTVCCISCTSVSQKKLVNRYNDLEIAPTLTTPLRDELTVTYFGVSTLLFRLGSDAILIDGFFSRPKLDLFKKIQPNGDKIQKMLNAAGILTCLGQQNAESTKNKFNLSAIYVVHSHFDHSLDVAEVAALTGAAVYGSQSTKQILMGYDASEAAPLCTQHQPTTNLFKTIDTNIPTEFHNISVDAYDSRHIWTLASLFSGGRIKDPLKSPAYRLAFQEGKVYGLKLVVEEKTILVHASARCPQKQHHPGKADIVFLGVGALGIKSTQYVKNYWECMVENTEAKRVYAIHWDDFEGDVREGTLRSSPFLRVPQVFKLLRTHDKGQERLKLPPVATPFSLIE